MEMAEAPPCGELPGTVDRDAAYLMLVAIFFGVPMAVIRVNPELVGPVYRQQLAIAWSGLRNYPMSKTSSGRSSHSKRGRKT